ncbi:MAG: VOC family protein [Solirubrobacterales bacterium]|nr:VOC family protein [Solirubrobacterales bacterium]
MGIDLFAGCRVSDFETSKAWYERSLGAEPSFIPNSTEAVWELAEHRFLFIVESEDGGGGADHLIFVNDLDAAVQVISSRGIEPDERETYPGKVRKATYVDPDGNEISYGGPDA